MWEVHVNLASMMILEFLQMWEIRYCGKCDVMGIPAMCLCEIYDEMGIPSLLEIHVFMANMMHLGIAGFDRTGVIMECIMFL